MLVMMSFNAVLFGATVVLLAVCEAIMMERVGPWGCGGGGGDGRTDATGRVYEMVGTDG